MVCGLWLVVCDVWFLVSELGFGVWGLGSGSHIPPIVGDEARVCEEGVFAGVLRRAVHL